MENKNENIDGGTIVSNNKGGIGNPYHAKKDGQFTGPNGKEETFEQIQARQDITKYKNWNNVAQVLLTKSFNECNSFILSHLKDFTLLSSLFENFFLGKILDEKTPDGKAKYVDFFAVKNDKDDKNGMDYVLKMHDSKVEKIDLKSRFLDDEGDREDTIKLSVFQTELNGFAHDGWFIDPSNQTTRYAFMSHNYYVDDEENFNNVASILRDPELSQQEKDEMISEYSNSLADGSGYADCILVSKQNLKNAVFEDLKMDETQIRKAFDEMQEIIKNAKGDINKSVNIYNQLSGSDIKVVGRKLGKKLVVKKTIGAGVLNAVMVAEKDLSNGHIRNYIKFPAQRLLRIRENVFIDKDEQV